VNRGRGRLKVSFQVSFGWGATVDLRVVVDERKVLPLFLRKSHFHLMIHLFGTTTPLSCGPEARLLERIVPERASARKGTVFTRSSSAGSFPKHAAIRERLKSVGAVSHPLKCFVISILL